MHKVQGLTVKKAIVSLDKIFKAGMGYVALNRVTDIEGLYLLDNKFDNVYADTNTSKALEMMPSLHIPANIPPLSINEDVFKTVFHNIQSLPAHFMDLKTNIDFMVHISLKYRKPSLMKILQWNVVTYQVSTQSKQNAVLMVELQSMSKTPYNLLK